MAQLNITLNQEEILQLLSNDRNEVFRKLLESSLNSVLKAESQEQLKAHPYERTLDRTDSRNGSRERKLQTRIGTITLNVPGIGISHSKQCFLITIPGVKLR